jgi:TetR/AcrR family transcriptional regulator, cholesterol catabolism regulator
MDSTFHFTILKTSAKLFLKFGLRSVSIDDICNELRISKKTFYQYFPKKEDLVEAVLIDLDQKKQKRIEHQIPTDGNVIDNVMCFSASRMVNKNNQFMRFFFDLVKYYPEIHKRHMLRSHKDIYSNVQEIIVEGINQHLFRNDLDINTMTQFIAIQFMTAMNLVSQDKKQIQKQPIVDFLIDSILRILCNESGLKYYLDKQNVLLNSSSQTIKPPLLDEEIDRIIDNLMDNSGLVLK